MTIIILTIEYNTCKLSVPNRMIRQKPHSKSNQCLHPPSPSIQHILAQHEQYQHQLKHQQQDYNQISNADSPLHPHSTSNDHKYLLEHELFKQSYSKIQKIKNVLLQNSSHQLMYNLKIFRQELNDIIDLLRGERVRAKITIEELRHTEDTGQLGNERMGLGTGEIGVNTEDMLECQEFVDISVQTEPQQANMQNTMQIKQNNAIRGNNNKKYQSYYKLVCMIDKLKVDYRQVLPILKDLPSKYTLPNVDIKKDEYKILKPEQILKLQKVFISKLNSMIANYQNTSQQQKKPSQPQTSEQPSSQICAKMPSQIQQTEKNEQKIATEHKQQQHPRQQQRQLENSQVSHSNSNQNQNENEHSQQKSLYKSKEKKPMFYQLTRKRIM